MEKIVYRCPKCNKVVFLDESSKCECPHCNTPMNNSDMLSRPVRAFENNELHKKKSNNDFGSIVAFILGFGLLGFVVFFVIGWLAGFGDSVLGLFMGCAGAVGIPLAIYFQNEDSQKDQKKKIEADIRKMEAAKIRNEKINEVIRTNESKYGSLTKKINLPYSSSPIQVFNDTKIIIIKDREYKYSDILGFSITDNYEIIQEAGTAITKTSTGSMVGRAVVGGVLTGGVGAIVGGATAKKKTEISAGKQTIKHNFSIKININDMSNPLLRISCYDNGELCDEITSVLNIIINQNKSI